MWNWLDSRDFLLFFSLILLILGCCQLMVVWFIGPTFSSSEILDFSPILHFCISFFLLFCPSSSVHILYLFSLRRHL